MTRIFTFVLATLLVVATPVTADHASALAAEKSAPKSAKTTVVDVDRPTVIVFAPPQWEVESKSDKGVVEMVAHVRFAVEDVKSCKGASRISVRMVFADRLALTLDGRRTTIDLSRKFPDSAGAYLFRPGRKPCAIATPNDTAFLGDLLSRAVVNSSRSRDAARKDPRMPSARAPDNNVLQRPALARRRPTRDRYADRALPMISAEELFVRRFDDLVAAPHFDRSPFFDAFSYVRIDVVFNQAAPGDLALSVNGNNVARASFS